MLRQIEINTFYTPAGHPKTQTKEVARTLYSMRQAINSVGRGASKFVSRNHSVKYTVEDSPGRDVDLRAFFRHFCGEARFEDYMNDEHFATNLDTRVAHYVVTNDLDASVLAAQTPSVAAALQPLNTMFG